MTDTDSVLVGAVDLGGTKILSVAVDRDGAVRGEDLRATEAEGGPDAVLGRIAESLLAAVAQAGPSARLRAAGIATPGPIDFEQGIVVQAPNLPGWRDVPVAARLGTLLSLPVVIENDANAAAWGEFVYGASRGARHMIYLTVSTGIGGGIVLDGHLYRGASGAAGEMGHIQIVDDGPLCGCGAHGCLEQLASGTAIARRGREAVAAGRAPLLAGMAAESGEVTSEQVHEAALQGDADARAVIEEAGRYLGRGLTAFVNIFNPDLIVIGGGASQIGPMLFDPALAAMRRTAMRLPLEHVQIVAAALGGRAGALGAAALAADRVGRT